MKDIQGIQRGKCNSCECEEYRAPSAPGVLRCEYCNHTPGEHVRMVDLGACTKCGKDNCDKYVSEDPNSYTDCQYCGCGASHHEGAAALRRPQQQPSVGGGGGVVPITTVFPQSASIQPRVSQTGKPQQTSAFGGCSMPGCLFPKRIEGDRVHDYCSRTCAQKHRNMQASFHQQKAAAAHQAAGMPYSSSPPSQQRVFQVITKRPSQS